MIINIGYTGRSKASVRGNFNRNLCLDSLLIKRNIKLNDFNFIDGCVFYSL